MRIHTILCLIHLCLVAHAQNYTNDRKGFCGTETEDRFIEGIKAHTKAMQSFSRNQLRSIGTDYPVTVHIIRKSDGSEGIDVDSFLHAFNSVNAAIAPSGVSLKICADINYIDSDQYYDFYKPDENNLYYSTRVPNTMNLYISNSLTYASGAVRCGYAYFPGWKDMVLIDRHCALDGNTFIHEVGHYFGLLHTHGNEVSDTEELNNQSNCMITGDDVCDTPADPLLTWTVDSATCAYIGDEVDINGEPYSPDPSNIMSYAPKNCKQTLTEGQYDRMAYVGAFLRDYLTCQPFTADFELDEEVGICGESHVVTATYTGTAEDIDLAWDMNADGEIDAESPFAQFTFTTPGRHDICLMAIDAGDTVQQCRSFAVLGSAAGAHDVQVDNLADCALINEDRHHGWQVLDLDSMTTDVLVMDNFHYNADGAEDHIVICPIDLTGLSQPALQLDLGYVPYSENRSDGLRIDISTDCGLTYEEIFFGHGIEISSTAGYSEGKWQPYHPGDWQNLFVDLFDYTDETIVIRITNITGHGNYMYIKDISVSDVDPLPVSFISMDVTGANNNHFVTWKTAEETGVLSYAVQRSSDGLTFHDLGSVLPEGSLHNTYGFKTPALQGRSYYRIEVRFEDGTTEYSPIRTMEHTGLADLTLSPNPAVNYIQLTGFTGQTGPLAVYNSMGQLVIKNLDPSSKLDISNLQPGIYIVMVNGLSRRFTKVTH